MVAFAQRGVHLNCNPLTRMKLCFVVAHLAHLALCLAQHSNQTWSYSRGCSTRQRIMKRQEKVVGKEEENTTNTASYSSFVMHVIDGESWSEI
jgi:ABC-type uncharacterized transport system auxiliary subunit